MKYQRHFQLPAKFVEDPGMLWKEVSDRAGKGNFHIEMRHNMYSVTLFKNVDVKGFYSRRQS